MTTKPSSLLALISLKYSFCMDCWFILPSMRPKSLQSPLKNKKKSFKTYKRVFQIYNPSWKNMKILCFNKKMWFKNYCKLKTKFQIEFIIFLCIYPKKKKSSKKSKIFIKNWEVLNFLCNLRWQQQPCRIPYG